MSTELAKISKDPLAIPDYLKEVHGHEGSENVTKDDLIIPRLAICQSTNAERKKTSPKYIEGLDDGDFFNTSTRESYGPVVHLIPLLKTSSRIYFESLNNGGGILCRSMNGVNGGTIAPLCMECTMSQGFPSPCLEFKNFLSVLLPSKTVPVRTVILASMKSTALTAAKQWISRMQDLTDRLNKPFYTGVYELTTVPSKNKKGEFMVPVIKRLGFASQEDFLFCEAKYKELKGSVVKLHEAVEAGEVQGQVESDEIPF